MSSGQQQQRLAAAAAAASLVRTLNNPYNLPSTQPVNSQGYTYSPTYNLAPVASSSTSRNVHPPRRAPTTHWYTPGNSRCTYPRCAFTASPKSLEIHMMDRHLIYPPGWYHRPRQSDWDADPSLKGYVPQCAQLMGVIQPTTQATCPHPRHEHKARHTRSHRSVDRRAQAALADDCTYRGEEA